MTGAPDSHPSLTLTFGPFRLIPARVRKVLGDGQAGARYIVNVMGRGYCFVAPVRRTDGPEPAAPTPANHRHNLPALLTRVLLCSPFQVAGVDNLHLSFWRFLRSIAAAEQSRRHDH